MSRNRIREKIHSLLRLVDDYREDLHLLLVVNTKRSYSLPDDYPDFSVTTEFLSDEELDELLGGFRETGVLTDLYVGEMEFVRALLGTRISTSGKRVLVYSTVPSGVWNGRDALIPALCGLTDIGFCSGDAYAMSVAGNKYYGLKLAEQIGESTGGVWLFDPTRGWCNGSRPPDGLRVIVKPALECASIGIDAECVRDADNTLPGFLQARSNLFGEAMLVQTFIPGSEIEVPVFGAPDPIAPAAFGIAVDGRRDLGDTYLMYHDVYDGDFEYYPAAEINPTLDDALRASACRVFTELGLRGFARIDYRVRKDGSWAITDINAIPHLTRGSANHLAFQGLGLSYPEVLKLVIAAGLTQSLNT